MLSDPRHEFTTNVLTSDRSLVLSDPGATGELRRAGIEAATFAEIRAKSDLGTMTYFAGEPAVLIPSARREADVIKARLGRLGIAFRVVEELIDRRLP